jgi:predicted nucleic acid-binding protein
MKKIFIDTNAFIALYFKKDQFHHIATNIHRELLKNNDYVTSNYVIDETITGLVMKSSHADAVEFFEDIKKSTFIDIIYINDTLEHDSFNLFKKLSDKEFSFTDCTSFLIMKHFKIKTAFTNDHHFEQMGFEILIK